MEPLAVAGFLALVNERVVSAFVTPIFAKFNLDKFWLMYIAWLVGGVLVWLSGANIFAEYIPGELVGKLLTAFVAGGGSNLLHDIFDKPKA